MPARIIITVFMVYCLIPIQGITQIIHGEVYDATTKELINGVIIENIYTTLGVTSGEKGNFLLAAESGQLLEFRKQGYKTTRARIPMGYIPSYFRIGMQKGFHIMLDTTYETRYNYTQDSARSYELYKHELDFPKMSGIDMLASPFSALSSKSREVWRFQEEYTANEKEKYVDNTFNEELITRFTGLTGDSLHHYMKRFRPSYEQLHAMNDYTYFNFIKQTVKLYRHPQTQRGAQ